MVDSMGKNMRKSKSMEKDGIDEESGKDHE